MFSPSRLPVLIRLDWQAGRIKHVQQTPRDHSSLLDKACTTGSNRGRVEGMHEYHHHDGQQTRKFMATMHVW